ncbi:MAG: hypothetical protein IPN20_23270 [Haliscomenobacter sp.]|nr:hypothetical protein [Haliscomenobacter sp.]
MPCWSKLNAAPKETLAPAIIALSDCSFVRRAENIPHRRYRLGKSYLACAIGNSFPWASAPFIWE